VGHFVFVRRGWRLAVLLALALGVFLVQVAPAGAVAHPGPIHHRRAPRSSGELVWNVLAHGVYGVDGFLPTGAFDPTQGYPTDTTDGYTPTHEYFAGIIVGEPTDGSPNVSLYCIDIKTDTYPGTAYNLGTWGAANVPNVGYVSRILDEYYPHIPTAPAGLDEDQRAAAVQMAIWFFSDGFVASTDDLVLYNAVVAIVDHVLSEGTPPVKPPSPSLTLTPPVASAPTGGVAGPFTVTSAFTRRRGRRRVRSSPDATVTATGGNMYSDAAGTQRLGNPATLSSGSEFWVRSTGPASVALTATATATVPGGNVYLYAGGASLRQKLILADTGTMTTTVNATAEFKGPGSLVVKKTIAGPAAGSQGQVVIHVACTDGVTRDDFTIRANAPAGTTSKTYDGIPAFTKCTVTETSKGGTSGTSVVVTGDGQQVTIPGGGSQTSVELTDTYSFVPGSLIVRKTIAGPAAGQQGAATIHTVCNGTALTPDFVIPAGTPAGSRTMEYDQIPPNATCTATEITDGHTSAVSVVVEGSGQPVSVPAGHSVTTGISDTYGLLSGQLDVTKTIAGPQAGHQGPVVIHTVCTPAPAAGTPDFMIPAGATGDQSHVYSGISAGASCVVTETADGATSSVSAVVTGSPDTVTIPPGGGGAAHITDTYGAVPGSLLVTKSITGPFAGQQGPVTVHAVCNGTALSPDFVIPAGTPAGNVSHSFDGISAGSVCTVSETADGATATVTATVSGNGQNVTVPAGQVVPVSLVDVYEGAPGSLIVTKKFRGSAAHQHGRIAILVACGGPVDVFSFVIPAHTGGSVSRRFDGLPAGSRCTVTEVAAGRTARVTAVAIGKRQQVTIPANGTATVHITDKFSVKAIAVTRPPAVTG